MSIKNFYIFFLSYYRTCYIILIYIKFRLLSNKLSIHIERLFFWRTYVLGALHYLIAIQSRGLKFLTNKVYWYFKNIELLISLIMKINIRDWLNPIKWFDLLIYWIYLLIEINSWSKFWKSKLNVYLYWLMIVFFLFNDWFLLISIQYKLMVAYILVSF